MGQDDELTARLDERYMTRAEFAREMNDVRGKLANDDKRLAVIETQIKINNWLTAAIASGIVALVVRVFAGA